MDSEINVYYQVGNMKCPKKQLKEFFSCDNNCIIIWNAPKSKTFIFGSFSVLFDHVLNIWNVAFFIFDSVNGRNGAF